MGCKGPGGAAHCLTITTFKALKKEKPSIPTEERKRGWVKASQAR